MQQTSFKSPFLIFSDVLSPLKCENIIDDCSFTVPDKDKDGFPVKTSKSDQRVDVLTYQIVQRLKPMLEEHYGIEYKGTERSQIEWYPSNCALTPPHCDNSERLGKKWVQTMGRDLTMITFLSDFNADAAFDDDFEVYGAKLEFPVHQFGFNPVRGTVVIFPSGPHFINGVSAVHVGNSYMIRTHIAAKRPLIYDPKSFPGDYTKWF